MVKYIDPDQDPEVEVWIVAEIGKEIDPEIDIENMEKKERRRNRLRLWLFLGLLFSYNICILKEFICCEGEFLSLYILFIYISLR